MTEHDAIRTRLLRGIVTGPIGDKAESMDDLLASEWVTTDQKYRELIANVLSSGDPVHTRNADTYSSIDTPPITFTRTPLVTVRKTSWKMALREMEWFMSGRATCPEELLPWWDGQLNPSGQYLGGYGEQFRYFGGHFDQVAFILNGLRNNPNSRRLILTAWNPADMAAITEHNGNPKTPTTCHSTLIQFVVRGGKLHAKHYQRSADLLLGVPHNWIQHWALLLYFARHSGLGVGSLRWDFGDAHVYDEESHLEAARKIIMDDHPECNAELVYKPEAQLEGVPEFLAADFEMVGEIPMPSVTVRPRLIA